MKTGLKVKVDPVAEGLQCQEADGKEEVATITIQEGKDYRDAITDDHSFSVVFSRIPEGVTVLVPKMVPLATGDDEAGSFGLILSGGSRTDGVGKFNDDDMAPVELSQSGSGEVIYNVIADTTGDPQYDTENDPLIDP